MRNQRGMITVDFIFAMVLILGMSGLMFALTMSLSVAAVTQYIVFASSRNYLVGHINLQKQEERARLKYQELINNDVFKPFYKNGWFQVSAEPTLGDHVRIVPEYEAATGGKNKFWGAGTTFVAKILDFRLPFYGSTVPDGDGTGSGFTTRLGSYLGREPTTQECIDFTAARWNAIRNLDGRYANAGGGGYFPMTDDGC